MTIRLRCSSTSADALVCRALAAYVRALRPGAALAVEIPDAQYPLFADLDLDLRRAAGTPFTGDELVVDVRLDHVPDIVAEHGIGLDAAIALFNRQALAAGRVHDAVLPLPRQTPPTAFRGDPPLPPVPRGSLFVDDPQLAAELAARAAGTTVFTLGAAGAARPNLHDVGDRPLPAIAALAERCTSLVLGRVEIALATDSALNRDKPRFISGAARAVRFAHTTQVQLLDDPRDVFARIDSAASLPALPRALAEPPVVLLVSHRAKQCGVYEYGKNIASALRTSRAFDIRYVECSGEAELRAAVAEHAPVAIVYNRNSITMPWLTAAVTRSIDAVQIGILHEVTQAAADAATDEIVAYHLAQDPTLVTANPIVFPTQRLLPAFDRQIPLPDRPTIGSFGFGVPGKGFERIVAQVCREFDEADVRLHIPFNDIVDANGAGARRSADLARAAVTKPGVRVIVDHDFFTRDHLLDFCAGNWINAFFYDPAHHAFGISSVIDYALAVRRPIAISDCAMFRPIAAAEPSIVIERTSLREILAHGFAPLEPYYRRWSQAAFVADYERILGQLIANRPPVAPSFALAGAGARVPEGRLLVRSLAPSPWAQFAPAASRSIPMHVGVPGVSTFNCILDDAARARYAPAIAQLFRLAPEMMARKIPEANVQQAFVFDTVSKVAAMFAQPRILCAGSFEDSASESLKRAGFAITEIDPEVNYDLETFCALPGTVLGSWDIVFSTSVLEHVEDDERFMELVGKLLAPGGIGVFTVDFDEQYTPGKPIPPVDHRMYTKRDFTERLMPLLGPVRLLGAPAWEYGVPDFHMAGYNYTFATLTFEKLGALA